MRSKALLAMVTVILVAGLLLPAAAMGWTLDTHEKLNRAACASKSMKPVYIQSSVDGDAYADSGLGYSAVYPWYWYIHFNTNQSKHTHDVFFTTSDTRYGWWDYQMGQAATDYKAAHYGEAAWHVGLGLHAIEDITGHGQMYATCHQLCSVGAYCDKWTSGLGNKTAAQRQALATSETNGRMGMAKAKFPKLFN
jgi:hypothetical protein